MVQAAITKEDIKAALEIVKAVADIIKTLGEVPEGHLYAQLMNQLTLEGFNGVIHTIQRAGLITVKNHLITWIVK